MEEEQYVEDQVKAGFDAALQHYEATGADPHGNLVAMAGLGATFQGVEPMGMLLHSL